MRSQMTMCVQRWKDGKLVREEIPANDVEIEVDNKKVKVGELIADFIKKDNALKKELGELKKYVDELNKNDVEWKTQTNEILKTILTKIDEQEMI
jgi:hypothetical protein